MAKVMRTPQMIMSTAHCVRDLQKCGHKDQSISGEPNLNLK